MGSQSTIGLVNEQVRTCIYILNGAREIIFKEKNESEEFYYSHEPLCQSNIKADYKVKAHRRIKENLKLPRAILMSLKFTDQTDKKRKNRN